MDISELSDIQRSLLKMISIQENQYQYFINLCKHKFDKFGVSIIHRSDQNIKYLGKSFKNYEGLIHFMGSNLHKIFSYEINMKLDQLIKDKKMDVESSILKKRPEENDEDRAPSKVVKYS